MLGKLSAVENRFEELTAKLSDPEVLAQPQVMQKLAKEHSDLRELVETFRTHRDISRRMAEARELQKDPEMRELARAEETELSAEQGRLEERLTFLLLPKDPNDDKNILLEIRAGTGGEEAALFAADLYRMYGRFAERRRWKVEVVSHVERLGGWNQGSGSQHRGQGRLFAAQVRIRRAPRAARAQ